MSLPDRASFELAPASTAANGQRQHQSDADADVSNDQTPTCRASGPGFVLSVPAVVRRRRQFSAVCQCA
jgi:hypothetical protein